MSIYSRRRRFVYSMAMAALLATVYVGFRVASDTFLDVERNAPPAMSLRRTEGGGNEAIQLARTWFAHAPWVGEARKQFYDEGRYLYCRDFSLINNDRSLKFTPIAMLWQSDDERDPVTVVADSAQLTTTEPLSMNSSEFGKITRGLISGNVQIQGPDNLKISGRTFQLDQDSMKLFSSDPIRFQYDTHTGVASGGVDVFLSAAADSDGDLTDVDHVTQVQLHGQVSCNFFVPATKPDREDVKLQIIAAGGFTFDVDMKTCTFSGLAPDGRGTRLNPKEEVWVRRIHPDGNFDQLVCPELQLHFRNELDPVTGQALEDKLVIERFTAWGRSVIVESPANKLIMQGTELHYSLDEGRLDLKHSDLDASGKGQMVRVKREGITLEVPHVRVLMTEDSGLQRVECLGGGRMFGEPPKRKTESPQGASAVTDSNAKPSRFWVNWDDELTFRKLADEAWLVDLLGNAVVQESSREFRLKGQQIQVRLEEPTKPAAKTVEGDSKILQVGHSAAERIPDVKDDFDLSNLVPRLMTAAGDVTMSTPEGSGEVRERLVVKIFDQPLTSAGSTQDAKKDQSSDSKNDAPKEVSGISFSTDRLEAIVHRPASDAGDQELQFQSVWLKGDVKIDRKSQDPDKQFSAEGTMLQASSTANNDLDLKLFGDPAKLNSAKRNMESTRIDLNQIDANVNAVGSGRIRFYTDKGFDGEILDKPAPLDIYWSDRMSFEPRSATFVGNIRIAMTDENTQDVEILCAGLKVFFTRDVTLGKSEEDGSFQAFDQQTSDEAGPIERIECMSKVNVRIDQYDDGQHVGRHRMEMVDLKMNLETGDFHAIGPGFLESASPDRDGALQGATPVTVRPNSPAATSETAFVYVKADFIGDIKGNRKLHMATLSQNVVALIAPTPRVDEQISLDLIPFDQLPLKAGLLRAQQVTLSGADGDSFSMVARDNARLESQTLSASADVITYDHTKQQFIIRTEGDNEVIAVHRSAPGRPVNRLKGKRFEYYRRTNQLKADGIGGLQIGN